MDGFLFQSHLLTISKKGSLCLVTHLPLTVGSYIKFSHFVKSVSIEEEAGLS